MTKKPYSEELLKSLEDLKKQSPDIYTHAVLVQWNSGVSRVDYRRMAALDVQVFERAGEDLIYFSMIHEVYSQFSTKLVEWHRQRKNDLSIQEREEDVRYMNSCSKHLSASILSDVKFLSSSSPQASR